MLNSRPSKEANHDCSHTRCLPEILSALLAKIIPMKLKPMAVVLDARGCIPAFPMNTMARCALILVRGDVLIRNANGETIDAIGISDNTADNDKACCITDIGTASLRADTDGPKTTSFSPRAAPLCLQ